MAEHYQLTGNTAATIADSIERAILGGELAAGELLPPIRELAAQLRVSAGTVGSAYRLVRLRGLTTADRRRGTRVRAWQAPAFDEPAAASGSVGTDRAGGTRLLARSGTPGPAALDAAVTDLGSGNPDPRLLPDLQSVIATLDYEPALYGTAPVCEQLAQVATSGFARDGLPEAPLACTFGALDAIARVLASSLRPGDRIAVEDPGWPALLGAVARWGFRPVPVAVDDGGPVADSLWAALAGGARAVVVTSRAQNPTGAVIGPERAEELRDVLGRYPGVMTIEDDHGHAIVGPECRLHPVTGHGLAGPWAFVRSAGKAYGPDLRLAVLTGDATTVGRVALSVATGPGWVSHLLQEAVASMWSSTSARAVTEKAAACYDERRQALCGALSERGVAATGRSGLNVWVPVRDEAAAAGRLLAAGYAVASGARFRLSSGPAIRITTAGLDTSLAEDLAGAVAEAVNCAPDGVGSY